MVQSKETPVEKKAIKAKAPVSNVKAVASAKSVKAPKVVEKDERELSMSKEREEVNPPNVQRRILTAEGWKRSMQKQKMKKA